MRGDALQNVSGPQEGIDATQLACTRHGVEHGIAVGCFMIAGKQLQDVKGLHDSLCAKTFAPRKRFNFYTPKEVPQPQVVLALGLLNVNPLEFKPPSK